MPPRDQPAVRRLVLVPDDLDVGEPARRAPTRRSSPTARPGRPGSRSPARVARRAPRASATTPGISATSVVAHVADDPVDGVERPPAAAPRATIPAAASRMFRAEGVLARTALVTRRLLDPVELVTDRGLGPRPARDERSEPLDRDLEVVVVRPQRVVAVEQEREAHRRRQSRSTVDIVRRPCSAIARFTCSGTGW